MVYDPRIPERNTCVLGALIEKWADQKPDHVAFIFADETQWTWAEVLDLTRRAAAGFHSLGVSHGDHVLSWQPNCKEALLTWFALNYLGAVYVPINIAYKGNLLEHVVQLSDAKLIICHSELAPLLNDIDVGQHLSDVILTGEPVLVAGLNVHPLDVLLQEGQGEVPGVLVEPWDCMYIIFTSGTTGPSKAVMSSYIQTYTMAVEAVLDITGEDRILANLPLFHIGGTIHIFITAVLGGSCVLIDSFKTDEFLPVVRKYKITYACLLGAMASFLLKRPPSEDDRDHGLLHGMTVPWNEESRAVAERYGLRMRTLFNMTETCAPLRSDTNPTILGTCGKPREGVEVRVVDENDCEVAPGEVGEFIMRTDRPWAMNHGYYKNPEATAAAWRNGWFHTGDAFRYDEDNNFFFVDRIKDAIRRRGENISSFEVESEVVAHPEVGEVAAIPTPSKFGEDDVMIVVAPVPGHQLNPLDLFRFLEKRMAHFMLPRYIRVLDELPKTPTQKVRKHLLRQAGVKTDTWDREAEGIQVKRQSLDNS